MDGLESSHESVCVLFLRRDKDKQYSSYAQLINDIRMDDIVTQDVNSSRIGSLGHGKILNLTIPSSAIQILENIKEPCPFVRDLINIGKRVRVGLNSTDPYAISALTVIRDISEMKYIRKSEAGKASSVTRKGTKDKPVVIVPEIVTPKGFLDKSYGIHQVSAHRLLSYRYIMLARNYGKGEAHWFLNDYLVKNEKKGLPISSFEELDARAQAWDNYKRDIRFPDCPEFYQFFMDTFQNSDPITRGYLLDLSIEVKRLPDRLLIMGCSQALNALQENKTLFHEIVAPNYPGLKFGTVVKPKFL